MFRLPSTPNPFTAARIIALPILWVLALLNWQPALGIGLALTALTDVLDGRLAKKYPQFADARFDSLADKLLTFSVIAWVIILKHQLITEHWMLLLSAAIIYSVSLFIGWRKHGHITAAEAAVAARDANVKQLFLTHISRRYNGHAVHAEASAIFPNTVACNDLDRYTVKREK
jgi:phosphatidylglycerophosphate synthase